MPTKTPSDVEPEDELDLEEPESFDDTEDEPEPDSFDDTDDDGWDEALVENGDEDVDVDEDEDLDAEDEEEEGDESTEALDELEAEELDMLTDDEASETLIVDEVQELRAIRRAELQLDEQGTGGRLADEFQCQSCFLVLKMSQLADKRKMHCFDCAG